MMARELVSSPLDCRDFRSSLPKGCVETFLGCYLLGILSCVIYWLILCKSKKKYKILTILFINNMRGVSKFGVYRASYKSTLFSFWKL